MSKKVSIIVPIYNVEKYLIKCLQSIADQTYGNCEVILVDDGSTDQSGSLADEFARGKDNFKVYHKKNGGLSDARNFGIKYSTGEYIGFVDSDDYIRPDMYAGLVEALERTRSDIACCGRFVVNRTKIEKQFCLKKEIVYSGEEAMVQLTGNFSMNYASWDKLYKKELLENIQFPYGRRSEDIPFNFQVYRKANRVVHIGRPMYYYLRRSDSITGNDKVPFRRADTPLFLYLILIKVKKNRKDCLLGAQRVYFEELFGLVYSLDWKNKDNVKLKKLVRKHMVKDGAAMLKNPYIDNKVYWKVLKIVIKKGYLEGKLGK